VSTVQINPEEPVSGGIDLLWMSSLQELLDLKGGPKAKLRLKGMEVMVKVGRSAIWCCTEWPGDISFNLRLGWAPNGPEEVKIWEVDGAVCGTFKTPLGESRFEISEVSDQIFGFKIEVKPTDVPMAVRGWPRDIVVVDHRKRRAAEGQVQASQRGSTIGAIFATVESETPLSFMYWQDLTQLNGYFERTETDAEGIVGGAWPAIGLKLPEATEHPLPPGEWVTLSAGYMLFPNESVESSYDSAESYLQSIAEIYRHLPKPEAQLPDWEEVAKRSARDLKNPKVLISEETGCFLKPYVDADDPDTMTQVAVGSSLWRFGEKEFGNHLLNSLPHFYNRNRKMLCRYKYHKYTQEQRPAKIDSWYLYHPLLNLARLGLEGHHYAKELLFQSLPFSIQAALALNFQFPVFIDTNELKPEQPGRGEDMPGETDVNGLFALLMNYAYELSGDRAYLDLGAKALDALENMSLSAGYQFNNTAWAALGCFKLWKKLGVDRYWELGTIYLGSFFQNSYLWEPDFGPNSHYDTFMGVSCLSTAEYMAIFECYESFDAFHMISQELDLAMPEWGKVLVAEYCKYALSRATFYYPENLPEEVLAKKNRNGHIDRSLAIPLEDLYVSRKEPGTVGQETYGAGAAFVFALRSCAKLNGAMVRLNYPHKQQDEDCLKLLGSETMECDIMWNLERGRRLMVDGKLMRSDRNEAKVPGNAEIRVVDSKFSS
jgi:hypothetical protein